MRPAVKVEGDTRERLLQSACEVFAEKGYRDATIAGICERAGANIAAVNYYFRSKERLYVEAWRRAFHRSLQAHPADGGVPAGAPAEERLRGRILSVLRRVVDPQSRDFDIVHKEMANPTGLLAKVMQESIEPLRQGVAAIVRELLGPDAPQRQVELCRMSIMAQCLGPMLRQRRRKMAPGSARAKPGCAVAKPGRPPPGHGLPEPDVDALADHVLRFSLAGIRETRRRIERGEVGSAGPCHAGKTGERGSPDMACGPAAGPSPRRRARESGGPAEREARA